MNPAEEINRWILLAHLLLAAGIVALIFCAFHAGRMWIRQWRGQPRKHTPPIPLDQIEVRMTSPDVYVVFDARAERVLDDADTMTLALDKARHHRRVYYRQARQERDGALSGDLPALLRLRAVLFGKSPDNG